MKKIDLVRSLADGRLTCFEISEQTGASVSYIREIVQSDSRLSTKRRSLVDSGSCRFGLTNPRAQSVADLADGKRTSASIAEQLGESKKYVQAVLSRFDLPRRSRGSATGELNGKFAGGRRIDRDGYVLVSSPNGYVSTRERRGRHTGVMYEHRIVMERKIGRPLLSTEVVDHIDGLRLHNAPENLRLFQSNSEHLKATITGHVPKWSEAGRAKLMLSNLQRSKTQLVDTYRKMKESGDARLIEILRAALSLGTESPYLSGSSRHLMKAGIFDLSGSSLEHELERLYQRYA